SGGPSGKGKVKVIGKNATGHLPLGVAALLQNQSSATVQVLTSDAACFGVGLTQVKKADGTVFKAARPSALRRLPAAKPAGPRAARVGRLADARHTGEAGVSRESIDAPGEVRLLVGGLRE